MTDLPDRLRLTVITDQALARPRQVVEVVREALAAGAPAIQLRLKDATSRELLEAAQELLPIVRTAGGLFIVNDRVDVALAAGADGAHLGPDDPPIKDARTAVREVLGAEGTAFVLGFSVDTPDGAARAEAEGADYLGVGAVYATANKEDAGEVIGLEGLRLMVETVSIPIIAIGGITPERAIAVAQTGACGIATIGAVMASPDPATAVRSLLLPFGVNR